MSLCATFTLILSLTGIAAQARQITFPPVAAYHGAGQAHIQYQGSLGQYALEGVDISTGSAFLGLTTFANLPYVHCLSAEEEIERYDIAFMGAPFDTVSEWKILHSVLGDVSLSAVVGVLVN